MSFCNVPPNAARGTPAFSAWATNIAKITAAGELIVIDVVIDAEIDPGVEILHVGQRVDRHPTPTDLAQRHRIIRVDAQQRRHVERRRQPVTTRLDDLLEPPVRVVRRPEPGEHPHRPQLRPVHRRIRAHACTGTGPGTQPSSGPYTGSNGMPDIVVKSASRSVDASNASSQRCLFVVMRQDYFDVKANARSSFEISVGLSNVPQQLIQLVSGRRPTSVGRRRSVRSGQRLPPPRPWRRPG